MKRIFLATVAALVVIVSASAQRLADVREEATVITDKMIAELGIGPGYRNSILNINLTYLNSINSYRDIDSYGWERATARCAAISRPDNGANTATHTTSTAPSAGKTAPTSTIYIGDTPPADRATTIARATTEATATIAPASTSIMAVRESTTEAMAVQASTISTTEAMADPASTTSTTEAMGVPESTISTTSTIAISLPSPI